jgi:hypothetical protein
MNLQQDVEVQTQEVSRYIDSHIGDLHHATITIKGFDVRITRLKNLKLSSASSIIYPKREYA